MVNNALSDYSLLFLRRLVLCSGKSLSNIYVAKSTSRIETISLHLVNRYSGIIRDCIIWLIFVIRYSLIVVQLISVISCIMNVFTQLSITSLVGHAIIMIVLRILLLLLIWCNNLWVLLTSRNTRHPLLKMLLLHDSAIISTFNTSFPIQSKLEIIIILNYVCRQLILLHQVLFVGVDAASKTFLSLLPTNLLRCTPLLVSRLWHSISLLFLSIGDPILLLSSWWHKVSS